MGSFNKIGFISSLPITAGDETTLIFMVRNEYFDESNSGVVYSTDMFEPAFLPIFGVYDDYGKIEYVERTKSVEFIEDFFGIPIETIIEEVDDNAVGRSNELTATKNENFYKKLTFGLELTSVYNKLSSLKRNAYKGDRISNFWLEKLGFKPSTDNSDKRFKKTWTHPNLIGYEYRSDGSYGHLVNSKTEIQHSGYTFYPSYLESELAKLCNNYVSQLTSEDKDLCSIDLSIKHTKLAIEEFEKQKTGDPEKDFRLELMGISKFNGYEHLTAYLKRCHIDGTIYDYSSRNLPKQLLSVVTEKEIADFIRFFNGVSRLNAKFQPSNYGSQDQDLKLHYEMLKVYRKSLQDKILKYSDEEDDFYNEIIAEVKSDDRDDKIMEVLS